MSRICEACERARAEVIEPCDNPGEPYHLCTRCLQWLHARSLRPVEWYNLAKRHGWEQFLLHDDFYDDDGTATQPEDHVEAPNEHLAPTLAEVSGSAGLLLDYSVTRWHFEPELERAWAEVPKAEIRSALSHRFASTQNVCVRSRLLEVCASALRESGADLVRYAWGDYPAAVGLHCLAEASAACLPFREGFDRVTAALAQLDGAQKRDMISALGYFHSTEALDWIEQNVFVPITETWGYLAAASRIDWHRVERWLGHGRPLSLVAIDALAAIVRPRTPFLQKYGPGLHNPPTADQFKQVLLAYAERDNVPRVQQRTAYLITHADEITERK
ncbi:hypothetical protein ACXR0O_24935 [Verrucomicrobiota bacterium sgz303538]